MTIQDAMYQEKIYRQRQAMMSVLIAIASRSVTGENAWELANKVLNMINDPGGE